MSSINEKKLKLNKAATQKALRESWETQSTVTWTQTLNKDPKKQQEKKGQVV